MDQKPISKLANGRYITIPVDAGEHIIEEKFNGIMIGNSSRQAIGVRVKAGETVYVNVGVAWGASNTLEQLEALNGRADVSVLRPQQ